jgi:peptidoglycan/xylan/chitin deacetylase (PgdA/CDA1 family)
MQQTVSEQIVPGQKKRVSKKKKIFRRIRRLILLSLFAFGVWFFWEQNEPEIQVIAVEIPLVYDFSNDNGEGGVFPTLTRFNGQERMFAYLTFDDGPTGLLPEILDILKEYNVQATFFMIGETFASPYTHDILRRTIDEGHYIGLHSMTHIYSRLYAQGYAVIEMIQSQDLLYPIIGFRPRLVRFPYGSITGLTPALRDEAYQAGLRMWDWTVDSEDWMHPNDPEKVLEITKEQIRRNREVILLHELPVTVEILPELIEYLLERGYEIRAYHEDRHFMMNHFNDSRF